MGFNSDKWSKFFTLDICIVGWIGMFSTMIEALRLGIKVAKLQRLCDGGQYHESFKEDLLEAFFGVVVLRSGVGRLRPVL
ncbi:transmembrane protein, putative [Medicago truncatula]|uniref:Transmembrane protein, putative n=1 Tax=Medicago truncatula TaxID=3880 RepID=G7KVH2_MEDTR|nr:transmembrane protein, putative [Medicago truncatula]